MLQHEILVLVHEAFKRFIAIHTVVQDLYIHYAALVLQRRAPLPEQADAAYAADSKEAHTGIHQAPNASHTGELATADDSSVVQCGEPPCGAGGSTASARFGAGEVMQYTASDFHPFKIGIVMMPGDLYLVV